MAAYEIFPTIGGVPPMAAYGRIWPLMRFSGIRVGIVTIKKTLAPFNLPRVMAAQGPLLNG